MHGVADVAMHPVTVSFLDPVNIIETFSVLHSILPFASHF